jgi:VWFA-related protein
MIAARKALDQFIEQIQPGDLVAIVQTSRGIGSLQSFTTDRDQLRHVASTLRWYPMGRGGIDPFTPSRPTPSNVTDEVRALQRAIDDAENQRQSAYAVASLGSLQWVVSGLSMMPGRKSVVLISEGARVFSPRSPTPHTDDLVRELAEHASRAGVVFYTVDPRGLVVTAPVRNVGVGRVQTGSGRYGLAMSSIDPIVDTQRGLRLLAEETGGLFHGNSNDLAAGLSQALTDQSGYYLIGYDPGDDTFDRKYHKLDVRVKGNGLKVRSRTGFYGVEERSMATAGPGSAAEALLHAIHSPFRSGEVRVKLTASYALEDEAVIAALLHIEGSDLKFEPDTEDWKKAVVDFLLVNFDQVTPVDQTRQTYTVRARGEELLQIMKYGLVYTVKYPVTKPGGYQVRAAVRDAATGRIGSASQFLLAPNLKDEHLSLSGLQLRPAETGGHANAATRIFPPGTQVSYVTQIHNARTDGRTGAPKLQTRTRILREGASVFDTQWTPFRASSAAKGKISAGGGLRLGLPRGEYRLQFLVRDELADANRQLAVQWIDFQVAE